MTGNLTPWLSHITVIPRLRAMRPVRTEVGVQVLVDADEDSASAVALLTTVEWNALHRGKTGRVPKDHSLSMMVGGQRYLDARQRRVGILRRPARLRTGSGPPPSMAKR